MVLLIGLAWAGEARATCVGDCDADGAVTVEEIVAAVGGGCPSADEDLRATVERALGGCQDRTALVIATNFQTGSFATVSLDEPRQVVKANPQRRVHGDAVARVHGGLVYVVNRFNGDNVQVLDPAADFATRWQCSVGNGANPHDIAFASSSKAYVTRHAKRELWIVDPSAPPGCGGFKTGEIDLGAFADADGIPEMDQMAIVGERLYVLLQSLDRDDVFAPAGPGRIAVIDTAADEVVGEIPLVGENPFPQTKGLLVRGGALVISSTGRYTVDDGGIESVDLEAQRTNGFFVTEGDLGGDILDFALVSERHAYAVLSLRDFSTSLVAFDPVERRVTRTLIGGSGLIADIEIDSRGELFAADRTLGAAGLRIFRAADGAALGGLLDTGLPPFDIVFLK